jgi:hypothetical protein
MGGIALTAARIFSSCAGVKLVMMRSLALLIRYVHFVHSVALQWLAHAG